MKKIARYIALAVFIFAVCAVIYAPGDFSIAVYDSLLLSVKRLIPSLFLMMTLSSFANRSGIADPLLKIGSPFMKPYGLPDSAFYAFFWGCISGFPIGAKTACELYADSKITKKEAQRLLTFCNNCSPAFLIGTLGMAYGVKAGIFLFIIQILSAMITGYIFCLRQNGYRKTDTTPASDGIVRSLTGAVTGSMHACLDLTAFLLFSSLFTVFVSRLPLNNTASAFIMSLTELTGGVMKFSGVSKINLSLMAFSVSFGGACVLLQTMNICEYHRISVKKYVVAKLVSGCASFITAYIFYPAVFESRFNALPVIFVLCAVLSVNILRKLSENGNGEKNAYRGYGKKSFAYKRADAKGRRVYHTAYDNDAAKPCGVRAYLL